MPSFTREPQQIFVTAVLAFDPREAVMEDAAVQKAVNHLFDIGRKNPYRVANRSS